LDCNKDSVDNTLIRNLEFHQDEPNGDIEASINKDEATQTTNLEFLQDKPNDNIEASDNKNEESITKI
jgi:hypothetical protein